MLYNFSQTACDFIFPFSTAGEARARQRDFAEIYIALDQREIFTILPCSAPNHLIMATERRFRCSLSGKIKAAIATTTMCTPNG